MLAGEPGIGKTSLAAKLSLIARHAGVLTLYGRCDQDLGIPYQPWREALSYLFNYRPEVFDNAATERTHVLAMINPPDPGVTEARDTVAHDPYMLFQSVLRILAIAAKPQRAGLGARRPPLGRRADPPTGPDVGYKDTGDASTCRGHFP